jgi:beta-mannosidase
MSTLVFDGVDYLPRWRSTASRWASTRAIFSAFRWMPVGALQRHNQLVVRVDSPYEDPQKVWPLHKTVMKGILNQHDTRPGGAWSVQGQDANSGGIWAPVRLHLSRGATLDETILRPDWSQGLMQPALKAEIRYRALTVRARHRAAHRHARQFQRPTLSG